MQESHKIHILTAGRIYQEDDVFNLTFLIVDTFNKYLPTCVYTLEQTTSKKIKLRNPQIECYLYNIKQHQGLITFVVTIGGDGTILYAAKQLISNSPPFLAFQRGTLGFMCRFLPNQAEKVVQLAIKTLEMSQLHSQFPFIINKTMRIESRRKKILSNEFQDPKLCVNEVFISRQHCERIILQIWIDNEFVTDTAGDGILISTPTGSTAYSLSAGGPIMQNGVNGILIVPIAPNSLSFRPICIPSSSKILLRLSNRSRSQAYISYDGQKNQPFTKQHELLINKSESDIVFYEPKPQMSQLPTWIKRLKRFLGWNEQFKNPALVEKQSPRRNSS